MSHNKKTLLASALALASLSAFAADYYIVVPVASKQAALADISVALNAVTLPTANVSSAYRYDFKNALQVTGDPTYSADLVSFSTSSALPAGLSLSSAGVLSGTPTVENPSGTSFQVTASYKTKTGQQAYTLVVNGVVLRGVVQITAGAWHTCVLTTYGGVKCWGNNGAGQLGDGTNTNRLTPVDVVGLSSGVARLHGHYYHTCALTTSGGVKCWGDNSAGQIGDGIGDGTRTWRSTPASPLNLAESVVGLAGRGWYTCALTAAGAVKCWGQNSYGQLGDGSTTTRLTPVTVSGLDSGVVSLAGGTYHVCAVMSAGPVKCWGRNLEGQLGDGTTTDRLTPVAVTGLSSGVRSLQGGWYYTCALTTAGGVKCWGANSSGQLGDGTFTSRNIPADVSGLGSGVVGLASGGYHVCAWTDTGAAKCWGQNTRGQLGDGSTSARSTPVSVGAAAGVTDMAAGDSHTCAIWSGAAWCWGYNNEGQLGNATLTNQSSPLAVKTP